MRVLDGQDRLAPPDRGAAFALGNFDGFHRGHQQVVAQAARQARASDSSLGVICFEPHPRSYFRPDQPAFRLTPRQERRHLLDHFGVDIIVELAFDAALAGTRAADFVANILVDRLGAGHIVAGFDYRFGRGREGDMDLLQRLGVRHGFGVTQVEPVSVGIEGAAGEIYSSTLVRQALRNGQPRRAAALLGHWWSLSSQVKKGDQRGRTIGFPTANLGLGEALVPAFGVYAIRTALADGRVIDGVANLGRRPTFEVDTPLIEAHLFDFAEDIYDQEVRVLLIGFIRPERRFDGLDALKAQIAADCRTARLILADPENAPDRLILPHVDDLLAGSR